MSEHQKYLYLKKIGLKFTVGVNTFVCSCELCGSKLKGSLRVSKKGIGYNVVCNGEFHHDEKGELHLYCRTCHKRIHDWGVIQRWLKKIGKTVDDLPDASKLKPMKRMYG